MTELDWLAGLSLGLQGSSHCLVMCGGISSALGLSTTGSRRNSILLAFQLGRILSYTLLGGLLGLGVNILAAEQNIALLSLRVLSGLLLIAMGLYISNWWRGLQHLERAGQVLWRPVQGLSKRWLPPQGPYQAAAVGMCWGMLPCGLIYSALAWSAAAASADAAALRMFYFGLGTMPAMLAAGAAAQQFNNLMRNVNVRRVAALMLIIFGLWTSIIALQHSPVVSGQHNHTHHQHERS